MAPEADSAGLSTGRIIGVRELSEQDLAADAVATTDAVVKAMQNLVITHNLEK